MDEEAIAASLGLPVDGGKRGGSILEALEQPSHEDDIENDGDGDGEEGNEPDPAAKSGAQSPEAVDIETLRQQAAEAANIKDMVQNNAPLLAQILLSRMTEEQRNAALAGAGLNLQANQEPVENPLQKAFREAGVDVEDMSPAEKFVVDHYDDLAGAGEKMTQLAGAFDEEIDTIYAYREFDDAVRNEFFNVIGEKLFKKALPVPTWDEYATARKAGKDTKSAVAETFGKKLRDALATVADEPKSKPRTPNGGGGGKREAPGADAGLWELIQYQAETGTKGKF